MTITGNLHMEFQKLYKLITPTSIHLWLVLLLCSVGSLIDVAEYALTQPGVAYAIIGLASLAIFKSTILTALYLFLRPHKYLRIIAYIVIGGFILLSLLNGLCWLFYGFGISRKLITIFSETNRNEVMEFLPELRSKLIATFFSLKFVAFALIFVIVWKFLPLLSKKYLCIATFLLSFWGMTYFIQVYLTADFGRANHLVYLRTYRCMAANLRSRATIKELQAKRQIMPDKESAESSYKAELVIVVIGESASRDHFSLYGYPLSTTPTLDTISEGLYIFKDAIASSTSTAENMPRLLTFMTDEPSNKEWYDYPTLLQLFKVLGYHTYWLSNQERTGEMSNLSGILSYDADVVKYLGSQDSEDHYLAKYDEILLPALNHCLTDNDSLRLVFLHTMGSHFQYHNRYPSNQHHFTYKDIANKLPRPWLTKEKAEIIANYDNSILYTDSILTEVINELRNFETPALMVYVSDHGENVYDDRDYRGRDPKFVKVPFLIYANEAYQSKNPDIIKDMESAETQSFSTSELPQMLLHLTGSRYSHYDSIRDPLSPSFRPRPRYIDNQPF